MKILSGFSQKRKIVFALLILILLLTLAFIWWHSAQPGYESTDESTGILALIKPFLAFFVGKENATDHLVRKLAHFAEFAILGIELIAIFSVLKKMRVRSAVTSSLIALIVAIIDETIQLFPPDRNASVLDVLLDFSGAIFGVLFYSCIYLAVYKQRHNTKRI